MVLMCWPTSASMPGSSSATRTTGVASVVIRGPFGWWASVGRAIGVANQEQVNLIHCSCASARAPSCQRLTQERPTGVDAAADRANVYPKGPARRVEGSPAFSPEKWALWHFYLHVRDTLAGLTNGTFPGHERQPSLNSRPTPCLSMRAG